MRMDCKRWQCVYLFHGGGPYHVEISPRVCRVNQRSDFYMAETSIMKELIFVYLTNRKQRTKLITTIARIGVARTAENIQDGELCSKGNGFQS